MADRLTPAQQAEVKEVLGALRGAEACGLLQLVGALREGRPSAFSDSDIDSIAAGISALQCPLEAKPLWPGVKSRGLFFVFEGLDRSGKSTQSKKLAKRLEQEGPVRWTCFPERSTAIGLLIDLYLRKMIELPDETIHQLFSANRWEAAEAIVSDLNNGTSVVCDRYAFSGVAYSAAKGLDFTWCQGPDRGLPVPDAIFYLHVDEKVGASRAGFGDERYENQTMQANVREEFQRQDLRVGVAWHDINGAQDIEVIHEQISRVANEARQSEQENGTQPLRRLWMT